MTYMIKLIKDIVLNPGETIRIPTGVAIDLPQGYSALISPEFTPQIRNLRVGLSFIQGGTLEPLVIKLTNYGKEPLIKRSNDGNPIASIQVKKHHEVLSMEQVSELEHFKPTTELATILFKLSGRTLPLVLDTAATRNCISRTTYERYFSKKLLAKPDVTLVGAAKKQLPVLGTILLNMQFEG